MILIFLLLSSNVRASTLFFPDSDTAALIMLVSHTAATVSNTLKILEVAKETSHKLDEFNRMAERKLFLARRIKRHAQTLKEMRRIRPRSLEELNRELLRLKGNLRELQSGIEAVGKEIVAAQDFGERHALKIDSSKEDIFEAQKRETAGAGSGTVAGYAQHTAMNTALSSSVLAQMRRDQLDYQRVSIGLQKSEAIERLRRDEFYKNWLGLGDEK